MHLSIIKCSSTFIFRSILFFSIITLFTLRFVFANRTERTKPHTTSLAPFPFSLSSDVKLFQNTLQHDTVAALNITTFGFKFFRVSGAEDCSKLDLIKGKGLAVLEFVTLLDNVGAFFFGLFLYNNNNIIKVITYCYYIFHYIPL